MKNSTLSRKPGHDMKKNVGYQPATRRSDQSGDGEDFAFNGQMGDGVNRMKDTGVCRNPHTIGPRADSQNYGLGPRTGNASSSPKMGAKAAMTIATAAQGGKIAGGASAHCPANPDKIYMSSYQRKGNE